MATYSDAGEFEPGYVYIQVKATDSLPRLADGKSIAWSVSRRDLKLWLAEAYPVILVVYDGQKDRTLWIPIQAYFSGRRISELFADGETLSVHIAMANRFNSRAIRDIARDKNVLHAQFRGKGHADV